MSGTLFSAGFKTPIYHCVPVCPTFSCAVRSTRCKGIIWCTDRKLCWGIWAACQLEPHSRALQCSPESALRLQELEEAERSKFQDLLPPMLSAMGAVLNDGDETAAQDALELFVEMADTNPKFLRKHSSDIISAMLQVCCQCFCHQELPASCCFHMP